MAAIATVFVLIAGAGIAYLLAMKNFRGKEFVDMIFTLPLVLPPTVTGYFLIVLFGRNGVVGRPLFALTGWQIMFTWQAAVLASFVVALPLMIKTARAAMESVDKSLLHASYTLGHSRFETAWRVLLPLSRNGIFAGAVLSFARALGEFGATLMLAGNLPGRTDTMPLAIYSLAGSGDWQKAQAMAVLFTVISGMFLYAANKYNKRTV